ncbi:MAG TPA: nitrite reductase small subunit NirD [Kineosporiaceae bacterium]
MTLTTAVPGADPAVPSVGAPGQPPGGTHRRHGVPVCRYVDLEPERGVAALVDGVQVAIFRLVDGTVLAVGHHDPFCGANVIARGIVGTRGDVPTVASPMYKQVFDLRTGVCLDDPSVTLGSHPVEIDQDGLVRVLPADAVADAGGTP